MFTPPTESDMLPVLDVLPEPYLAHVTTPVEHLNPDGSKHWFIHCWWTEGDGGQTVGTCDIEVHADDPELMYVQFPRLQFNPELQDTGLLLPKLMDLCVPFWANQGMHYWLVREASPAVYNYFLSLGFEETDLFEPNPEWGELGYKALVVDLSPSEDEDPDE